MTSIYEQHQDEMDQVITEAIVSTAARVGISPRELMRIIYEDPKQRGIILDRRV